jgi:NitT/TauT family transport system ATP-binding protein
MKRPASSPIVEVKHLDLAHIDQNGHVSHILQNINFDIYTGEKFLILGPSGCGKTTLLKAIAGFLDPYQGQILIHGERTRGPSPNCMMIFQDFEQLFPWRTVLDNVVYALRVTKKVGRREAVDKARFYLELVQMADAAGKYPYMLSGGMKQRASLARALALEPDILLMDEPFGALDAITRNNLQLELNDIWRNTGVTLIFVTHSIPEALFLGHRVMVMSSSQAAISEIVDTSAIDSFESTLFMDYSSYLRHLLLTPELQTNFVEY